MENALLLQLGEDASKGAAVEFILGQTLVHSFSPPGDTASIDGRRVDDRRLGFGEV